MEYSRIKSKSNFRAKFLTSSYFSSHFFRKYSAVCVFCLLILGVLYYQRAQQRKHIHSILPSLQNALILEQSPRSLELQLKKDRWQFIGDPMLRYQVYSAYFDPRLEIIENFDIRNNYLPYGSVRVFCILPLDIIKSGVNCIYRYKSDEIIKYKAEQVEPIHENFGLEFSAYYVVCPLFSDIQHPIIDLPDSVGLFFNNEPSTHNVTTFIPIKYSKTDILLKTFPEKVAVCVAPAHNNYSNALRITEFVELYKLMGVDKFYFYKKSISSDVDKVMSFYEKTKIAEIMEWNFGGYEYEKEVRYEGIFAALNDCLYRSSFVDDYKYTLIVDFDEIIMPAQELSLTIFLEKHDEDDSNSLNFQVVFFYSYHPSDYSNTPNDTKNINLYSQTKIKRTVTHLPSHTRSKYIAKGRNVIEAGNHFVWNALKDTREIIVRKEDGLLFHYRDDCANHFNCDDFVIDKKARKYETPLWMNVDNACKLVFSESGICPR